MSDQKTIDKINKLKEKRKTSAIIKVMDSRHADAATICAGLKALAEIRDEEAVNEITHYLNDPDTNIRLTACKAGISIGTEYMKTRVRHQLSTEQDPATKQAIQEAFNKQYH